MSQAGEGRVLIVCAIRLEFNLLCKLLRGARRHREDDLEWVTGRLRDVPVVVCLTGVGEAKVAACLPRMLNRFPVRLAMVVGLCGGLSPDVTRGRVYAPRFVKHVDQPEEVEQPLVEAVDLARCTSLVTVRDEVVSVAAKQKLHVETGASLVDMEAFAAAQILQDAGVPWLVIKAVSDDAETAINPRITRLLQPDGGVKWNALFWEVLTHPSLIRELVQLGKGSGEAMKSLTRAVQQIVVEQTSVT